jgi:hypothetical protein
MSYPQAGGHVVKFVPASQRAYVRQLEAAMSVIKNIPEDVLPAEARERILAEGQAHLPLPPTETVKLGVFVMISREETGAVWQMIRELPPSSRPHDVRAVFDQVLLKMDFHNGVVKASRDEIAAASGLPVASVSRAMTVLRRWGVISSKVEKEAGVRGPGRVHWRIHPRVAWIGDRKEREDAVREAPQLSLVWERREHHVARDPAPAL